MWSCPKCREAVENDFEVCWSCGTTREGEEDPHFFDAEQDQGPELEPESPRVLPADVRYVTLMQCSMPAQAHALRVQLEAAGIPVFLADEYTVTMDWLLSNAIGGIKVQVPEEDHARARELVGLPPLIDDEDDDEDWDEEDETAE